MSLHRFFVDAPLETGRPVIVGDDLHHLRDVLRLAAGDEIVLADRDARQAVARVVSVSGTEAALEIVRPLPDVRLPDVTLLQGLSRGPKMDLVVQKATEIGVRRIVPVTMRRSVVRLTPADGATKAERWRRIAAEAAKQSQRPDVPRVDEPMDLDDVRPVLSGLDAVLVPWEESEGAGIGDALASLGATPTGRVAVVVGPEGGMEDDEVERLVALGAVVVSLGPTILRTETAALVALALVSYELGGLGGRPR